MYNFETKTRPHIKKNSKFVYSKIKNVLFNNNFTLKKLVSHFKVKYGIKYTNQFQNSMKPYKVTYYKFHLTTIITYLL